MLLMWNNTVISLAIGHRRRKLNVILPDGIVSKMATWFISCGISCRCRRLKKQIAICRYKELPTSNTLRSLLQTRELLIPKFGWIGERSASYYISNQFDGSLADSICNTLQLKRQSWYPASSRVQLVSHLNMAKGSSSTSAPRLIPSNCSYRRGWTGSRILPRKEV